MSAPEPAAAVWHGRPAWIEIDLDAIAANVRAMQAWAGGTAVMAVVKADAYGLGAVEVAGAARRGGATWLAVACVEEGVQLRCAGFTCPILLLGAPGNGEIAAIVSADLTATVHELALAQLLSDAAQAQGKRAAVHIKLDSGLNRFGHRAAGFVEFARAVAALPGLRLEGLYTHFAVADAPADPFTRLQIERFDAMQRDLAGAGIRFAVIHAAASAGAIEFPATRYNLLRMGITLCGQYPAAAVTHSLGLQPAVALKARLVRLSTIDAGESVGYGRTYIAPDQRQIALLPLGYADGYPRAASNKTFVLVGGRRCPLVGRISMDQLTVDVTGVAGVCAGDEAVLVGAQGGERVDLDEIAGAVGTISYEILTHLGRRLPRLYLLKGTITHASTLLER